jgi:hypothetical protein
MLRIALRNILIMLGVALPAFVVSSMVIGWLTDRSGGSGPSLEALVGSSVYVYAMWSPFALAIAVIHQAILAMVPRDWPARATRLVVLASTMILTALMVDYVAAGATLERVLALTLSLLPGVVAYGLLAQPLRSARDARSTDT